MAAKTKNQQGRLYEQAAQFSDALETSQTAAVDQMLGAWTDSYWGIRQEMDSFLAKVEAAKVAGTPPSPAWAYQQQRMKNLLDTTKSQIARYAADASLVTEKAQWSAIQASLKHSQALTQTVVAEQLPGLGASLANVNPKVLESGVGFLSDGSVLRNHLALTLPAQAAAKVQEALIHGLATGKSQAWMTRKATEALGLSHSRAVTIMRTESLRAYRHASRAQYLANQDVLGGWVWNAHLDARTCVACALMDGTQHPLDATLDGHPRCRCAMVPRTKSWDDLGVKGIPDTRPPVRSGKEWLESQAPHVQRAMMGPAKFNAWVDGQITLDDMVGRTYSQRWGTMRSERSLVAILEDRNGNWMDAPAVAPQATPKAPSVPEPALVAEYAERYDLPYLQEWLGTPGNSPQALANVQAAINLKVARLGRQGPSLPSPDLDKVKAAVEKLAQAVFTKGYPSKGYSQTKAIYKAQAHGVPGTQVGVVKSLTWEQKITAQAILDEHDAALPALARAHDKAKAIDAAHGEALVIQAQKAADDAAVAYGSALDDMLKAKAGHDGVILDYDLKALDLDDALQAAGDDVAALAKVKAQQTTLAAHKEAYQNAQQSAKDSYAGTEWTSELAPAFVMKVDDDGWAAIIADNGATIHLAPNQVIQGITDPKAKWVQHLQPNPTEVKAWKAGWTDAEGHVMPTIYDDGKASLNDSYMTAQDKVDLQEALDQDWAAGKWKPEPEWVAKIKADLDSGAVTPDALESLTKVPDAKPLSKANINQAIQEWKTDQAAKASIPVPKPAIQVNKIKWEKVSDKQAQKYVDQVQSGQATVEDLYAAFQNAKNAGPKANYAKAILTLEGKGSDIPTPGLSYSEEAFDQIEEAVNDDTLPMADVADMAKAGDVPAQAWIANQVKQGTLGPSWAEMAGLDPDNLPDFTPTGTPVAPVTSAPTPPTPGPVFATKPPWEPSALKDTGKVLGTHGARVYEAPDGTRWLFKPPKDAKDGFLATLDEAASRFQATAGLKAPDTFVVTLGGRRGSIQRMFPSTEGFPSGFQPAALSKPDLDVVTREHVLDWFMSNHDGHRDQFLRLEDGTMVGIDKGQAFRWFGQDKLDWKFHPNAKYGAPEPVYNALWKAFAEGKDVDLDPPGQGALWDQIKAIQAIPDDQVRSMFREYAEQAAAQGKLALPQKSFTGVELKIPSNDVDAFLDALVARKNNLDKDFTALYEKAAKARAKALPGWKPKAAVIKGEKWVGKPQPTAPKPPETPTAQTAQVFDTWLADAKARYTAFAGKDLAASNNWARFRRVVDDLDEQAAKELLDRSYLRQEDYDQALDLIAQAKALKATLDADYKKAQAAHDKIIRAYKKDLDAWKEANGIKDLTSGMDEVIRHNTNAQGEAWAQKHFDKDRYTATQRKWLKSYTGSSYRDWNNHLRNTEGAPTQYATTYTQIDKAMNAQPIPEDVITHRGIGMGSLPFKINGRRVGENDDLAQVIGSVQVDHGYMSASVGGEAAFKGSGYPVQLKLRLPAGTPASYVQMFSQYGHEREIILARGTKFFIHNAYKDKGAWVIEAEVVPDDFDPINATPLPASTPWKAWL